MLEKFIKENNEGFVVLQNKLWNKYRYSYVFLQKCYNHNLNVNKTIKKIIIQTKKKKIRHSPAPRGW